MSVYDMIGTVPGTEKTTVNDQNQKNPCSSDTFLWFYRFLPEAD